MLASFVGSSLLLAPIVAISAIGGIVPVSPP
jgi:hypothetical protein